MVDAFLNLGWEEKKYIEYTGGKLSKEPILLDIGFNRGYFTDAFLSYYPHSKVFGFEPIEELYQNAIGKYSDNSDIEIYNYGLSNYNKDGVTMFYLQNGFDGMSSLHYRPKHYPKFNVINVLVNLKMLDEYVDLIPYCDYIKCDTEGNELFVLQGADRFISIKHPHFIHFEVGECYLDAGITFRQVVDFLYNKDYILYDRDFSLITPENVWENYDCQNYLAEYRGDL